MLSVIRSYAADGLKWALEIVVAVIQVFLRYRADKR